MEEVILRTPLKNGVLSLYNVLTNDKMCDILNTENKYKEY